MSKQDPSRLDAQRRYEAKRPHRPSPVRLSERGTALLDLLRGDMPKASYLNGLVEAEAKRLKVLKAFDRGYRGGEGNDMK